MVTATVRVWHEYGDYDVPVKVEPAFTRGFCFVISLDGKEHFKQNCFFGGSIYSKTALRHISGLKDIKSDRIQNGDH